MCFAVERKEEKEVQMKGIFLIPVTEKDEAKKIH